MPLTRFAGRIGRLPTQFFVQLVKKTEDMISAGHDVINLGRGNPDQPTPPHIVDALSRAARDPATHGYSPFSGLRALREAAARWYRRRFGVELDPDREVAVLIGSKIGLVEISLCLLEKGDLCLMPDPGYPDYWSGVALAGGITETMPLVRSNGFLPDYDAVAPSTADRARLMFLCYPNNPTSAGADLAFFRRTAGFVARHGIVVAHDLAYGELVFDGRRPVSFLQAEGAKEVGIEFYTLSKTYNMAGWRIGFAAGNSEVIRAITLIQDHLHVSQFPAVQLAAIEALEAPQDCVRDLIALYQERRDAFVSGARRIGWPVEPCCGSFYCWARVPEGYTSAEFADLLLSRAQVAVAPGVGFGRHGDGYVRISLTTTKDRIAEAVERVGRLEIFRG
ncbi:MAG: pyridoxal phosphate-dependent aminotransferase [Actinobacteria bacterium]|nr:pyridoxal phosphate-dependent aminotransferase [Actinomycetota bacterium]